MPDASQGMQRRTVLRTGATAAVAIGGLSGLTATAEAAATASASAAGQGSGGTPSAGTPAGTQPANRAPAGKWDRFNFSPASRTVRPTAVYTTTGSVTNASLLVSKPGKARTALVGAGSSVTLDFGQEVGGFVTVAFAASCDPSQVLGLTYSELSTYVSTTTNDYSNGGSNVEPPVCYAVAPGGQISTETATPLSGTGSTAAANPASQLRGGFRYLTLVNQTAGTVVIADVSLAITFAPNSAALDAYPNYFWCSDATLNRVWYAGAYTVQTNILSNSQGRVWPAPSLGWDNGARIGEAGSTVLVDGAKRDRTVWPGDMGISVLTDYVSLGDMDTVRNSLQTLYNHQASSGALPYAGPAVDFIGNSDAYHMWGMIGTAAYAQFTTDAAWVSGIYPKFKLALDWITARIDTDGLLNVTEAADWARTDADGKNIEANAIMYRTLVLAAAVAGSVGDSATAADCTAKAARLRSAVEAAGYWDASAGLYRDKPGSTLYPQDGNSLAVWFGLAPADRGAAISRALRQRWTPVGALTPEKSSASVHPFPGGMEVHAHFEAGQAANALDLIRLEWGYMLDAPQGTGSTFWEGYRTDGTSDYGGSYMSAAHGWSTGPTSALTFHLLGIKPAADGSAVYGIAPQPGGVGQAEGRLVTPGGTISVSWQAGDDDEFDLTVVAPRGTVNEVGVPVPADGRCTVKLGHATVWNGTGLAYGARLEAGQVVLTGVPSGTLRVTVRR